jgi:hypothetical protein
MKKNVGTTDKWIRWIAAAGLLGLYFSPLASNWAYSWVLLIAAGAALATGLVGFCGLYTLLGISTCPLKNPSEVEQKP